MKILAIRGKNLASLAGEFAIDFLEQPLASAGLFAISGPTGAGKSTLLDALCLALFDKTPRLQQAGSKGVQLRDVGDETLPPHDSRNLLRRGCIDGYAEVEFIGNDRQHYRSRWSVRRARSRADGKLQATEMAFFRLPDQQAIGGKKTEVQDAIVERLGLNFDQFTRAVLLAQNEFSVFLKAPDDERASLLETLTGTDAYSRISIRAFERAKQEKQTLDALLQQLATQQPLATAEREALLANIGDYLDRVAQAQRQKTALETHLGWHQRHAILQTAEQEAQTQLQQAQQAHELANTRRDRLQRIESLQPARPLLTEYDRLRSECQRQRCELAAAELTVASAQDHQQSTQQQQSAAEQQLQAADRRRTAVETEIVKARALDAQINTLLPQHQKLQQNLLEARQQLSDRQDQYRKAQRQAQQTASQLADCTDWLARHADWARLSEQWPRWETLFKQARTITEQLAASRHDYSLSEAGLRRADEVTKTARLELQALLPDVSQAHQNWQAAEAHAGLFDADALASEAEQQQGRLSQLRQSDAMWQALTQLNQAFCTQTAAVQDLSAHRQQAGDALHGIDRQLPSLTASYEQAAKMLDLAKLASSKPVEALRAQLKPESECPVCGSTQHPFAGDAHPLRNELQALESEVQACLQCKQQAEQQRDRLSVEIQQFDRQTATLAETLTTLTTQITAQRESWTVHAASLGCADLLDEQVAHWLTAQIQSTEQAQRAVSESLKAMSSAFTARDQARLTLDGLKTRQLALQQQCDRAKADSQSAELALSSARDKQQMLSSQLDHQLDDLDAAFEDSVWRQHWLTDAAGFYQNCLQQAQEWQTRQTQFEQWRNELSIRQTTLSGLQDSVAQAENHQSAAANAFMAMDSDLQDHQQQRQRLLNGRPVLEIESELAKTLNDAKTALQNAATAAQAAATRLATAQAGVSQLTKVLTAHQTQSAAAEQQLTQWIERFNLVRPEQSLLTLPELCELLQQDADELRRERAAMQQLDKSLAHAQTVLAERQQQCQQHLQSRSSSEPLETLETQLAALSRQLDELTQQLGELNLQRRMDDERLQASAGLQTQIAAQAAVNETWAKLGTVIGSADGKRFRNIAQQLTLDILLGYANQHLKDLSRRYRMERVGDTLALQVVDQDMGDEIRSVHSLSGGESFLLSLALALGLASLSSNRVRVESLFIDEGFGSLDADTLRVAMDALDSLQAMGRKVGVISHVQEMTERIGTRIEVKRVGNGLSHVRVL